MRASRLLRVLLLLQNRGRLTSAQLASELEVARRTVLRDLDALTEAGLPVVVTRGVRGGVELGFNYRSRLTGLTPQEAEALGVLLSVPVPLLEAIGLGSAGAVARAKLLESLPDGVRQAAARAQTQFRMVRTRGPNADPRVPALAEAIRRRQRVHIRARSKAPRTIHPIALTLRPSGWEIHDGLAEGRPIPLRACGDINISALTFSAAPDSTRLEAALPRASPQPTAAGTRSGRW